MYNIINLRYAERHMVNVAVVGPARSGKTHLVHALVGKRVLGTCYPTTSVSRMAGTANGVCVNVWDTPACVEASVPEIASGVIVDSDIVVVCYDGRKRWSPAQLAHAIGVDRCMIYLPHDNAFNVLLANETFDLTNSFFTVVPVHADITSILLDILDRARRLHPAPEEEEEKTLLGDSV